MFISINHIPVKPERKEDFERMFIARQHAVEKQPGFISLDVLTPGKVMSMGGPTQANGNEYQVLTRWKDEESFHEWTKSEAFKQAHSREIDPTIFAGRSYLTLHPAIEGASA